jgi:hypothetical protein
MVADANPLLSFFLFLVEACDHERSAEWREKGTIPKEIDFF